MNGNSKTQINNNESRPNWGIIPPRKIRMASAVWMWMKDQDRWLVYDEILTFNNGRRSGYTTNQLANLLGRYRTAFERSEKPVRVSAANKSVHEWKAI